jgi:hypothetical protein
VLKPLDNESVSPHSSKDKGFVDDVAQLPRTWYLARRHPSPLQLHEPACADSCTGVTHNCYGNPRQLSLGYSFGRTTTIEPSDFAELYETLDLILLGCKGCYETSQRLIGVEL